MGQYTNNVLTTECYNFIFENLSICHNIDPDHLPIKISVDIISDLQYILEWCDLCEVHQISVLWYIS